MLYRLMKINRLFEIDLLFPDYLVDDSQVKITTLVCPSGLISKLICP